MNARVLIVVVVAAVAASIATLGVLALFVVAFLTFARLEVRQQREFPESELVSIPYDNDERTVSVHVTRAGMVLLADRELSVAETPSVILEQMGPLDEAQSVADVTVIVVADKKTSPAVVQQLIKACQTAGFERFSLRAGQWD
jgi:biopolymer transport protein ExbD